MLESNQENKGMAGLLFQISCAIGTCLSFYSLYHHKLAKAAEGATSAACNINAAINCDAVATSAYSEIAGIPLGAFGLGLFIPLMILFANGFQLKKLGFPTLGIFGESSQKGDRLLIATMLAIGVVASLVLGYISFFKVGAVCLVCIGIYLSIFVAAAIFFRRYFAGLGAFSFEPFFNSGLRAVIFSVLAIIAGGKYASTDISSVNSANKASPAESAKTSQEPNTGVAMQIPVSTSPYQGAGEDFRKGDDDAKVTIVEFSDFQCPACGAVAPVLDQLYKKYFGAVRVVYKNYPLSNVCNESVSRVMHGLACEVAVLARCAGAKGKFWEYHDLAFANQRQLPHGKKESPLPSAWAKELGLTDAEIASCKSSKNILAKIKDDVAAGNKAGVRGTPAIYINGKSYKGSTSISALEREVQKVMNQ